MLLQFLLIRGMLLPFMVYGQQIQKKVVLHDGYYGNQIVRNHSEVHYYYHTPSQQAGYIIVTRVVEYLLDKANNQYGSYLQTDTLCFFNGSLRKGQQYGTFLSWPPGNIFFLETFIKGHKHGSWKGFYTTGIMYASGTYDKGVAVGKYLQYYANGQLAIETQLLGEKTPVTQYQDYYLNGQLSSKGIYFNGNKVNQWTYFDNQGRLVKTEYYTNRGRLRNVK